MLRFWDELVCQLFHGRWTRMVSYSRLGSWRCDKEHCRAQLRADGLEMRRRRLARIGRIRFRAPRLHFTQTM
jgi:hypothetical protein